MHGLFKFQFGNMSSFTLLPSGHVGVTTETGRSAGHKILNPRTGEVVHTLSVKLCDRPEFLEIGFVNGGSTVASFS